MKRQTGFTIVETLLALLVAAVIGFGGYYVWRTQLDKNKNTAASKTQSSQPTQNSTTSNQTSIRSALTLSQAVDATKAVYNPLIKDWSSKSMRDYVLGNPSWFTSGFIAAINAPDGGPGTANNGGLPLICGGANGITVPDSMQVNGISSDGTKASVEVKFVWNYGDAPYTVNLVASNGKWLIDGLSCSH